MQNRVKIGLAAAAIAALGLVAIGGGRPLPAFAQTDGFSEAQVRAIEKIAKDYLLSHPEVMLQVQEALENKQEAQRAETAQSHLPGFYKSLTAMKEQLASFSVGSGDLTIIEFFDYNCGYCRKTLPDLIKFIDQVPDVKVQFMEYPILSAGSVEQSKIAIAASKQGKYYEFHKAMLSAPRHPSKDAAEEKAAAIDAGMKVARELGLDLKRLQADIEDPETEALISKIAKLGTQMQIDGTPTFLAGEKLYPGAMSFEQLKKFVDGARKDGCKACTATDGVKDEKKS